MTVPTCRRCGRISVLDPCRECASPVELEQFPDEIDDRMEG